MQLKPTPWLIELPARCLVRPSFYSEASVVKISNREFFDPLFYKFMLQDFEAIRAARKKLKGRPDAEQMVILDCERQFEAFYKKFLEL
jgi:hypothetical protein